MSTRESGISRELGRASENILQAFIQKAQLDFQREQLELDERRLGLQKEIFSEDKRAGAFERVSKLAPFLKPGTSIGENEMLHDDLRLVFPGADPADMEGLGGLVLQPETWDNTIVPQMMQQIKAMSPETQKKFFERGTNRLMLGENLSSEELELRDNLVEWQRKSLEEVVRDPQLMQNIARKTLGQEPIVRIRIGGREVAFDSSTAANLAVEIWKHQDTMAYYRGRDELADNKTAQFDLAGEFMKQIADASRNAIQISRPVATEIIQTIHRQLDPADPGANMKWMSDLEALKARSPEIRAAVDMYTTAAKLGEDTALGLLDENPGLKSYFELGAALGEILPKERVDEILPGLARRLQDQGYQIAAPRRFRGFTNIEGVSKDEPARQPSQPELSARAEAIKDMNAFIAGTMTSSQILQKWGTATGRGILNDAQIQKRERGK